MNRLMPGEQGLLPRPYNLYELRFFALRRSGHHAIVSWIAHHFPKPVLFIEGVTPHGNPFKDYDSMFRCVLKTRCFRRYTRDLLPKFRFIRNKYLFMSFEEQPLAPDYLEWPLVGRSEYVRNIIVIRDPFNWMASRIKAKTSTKINLRRHHEAVFLWKQYAREYLGMTNTLHAKLCINYNYWFVDEQYRRSISENLGLEFTDAGLEIVPDAGRGSSFDRLKYDGKAQQMNVLGRWQAYTDRPKMRALFADEELIWLVKQCFPQNLAGLPTL